MPVRRYLIVGAILLVQLCVYAQNNEKSDTRTEISGTVRDSLHMKKLKGVTITLIEKWNQKVTDVQLTDESGNFIFSAGKNKEYQIKISMIGYCPKLLQHVVSKGGSHVRLGTIALSQEIRELESVEIMATKPILENKLDRLIVHVERDAMLNGATALEALRKVPMVAIDMEDRISLRGNQQVRILINGKSTGMANSQGADALRMLAADQIQSIEVMVNPTAKYDADGGGVINIITKKRLQQNLHGTVASTIGTRQGNWNTGFHVGGRVIGFSANVGSTWSWPVMTQITSEHRTYDGRLVASQRNDSKNRRLGYQTNIMMDVQTDSNNTFTSTFNFNRLAILTKNKITNQYYATTPTATFSNNKQISGSFDSSLDYRRRLRRKGQEIILSAQLSTSQNDIDFESRHALQMERVSNVGENREATFQIDYVHPIGMGKVEFGGKAIFRNMTTETIKDIDIPHDLSTDGMLTYRQQVTAAYSSLTMEIGQGLQTIYGLRYEHTFLDNKIVNGKSTFVSRYDHLIPNIMLGYQLNQKLGLKTSYSQRITRPSLYFLNPFLNTSDPINYQQGNPALRAELTHNLELGSDLVTKNLMINATLYFKKTSDIIEPVYTQMTSNNRPVTLQRFENIGDVYTYGFNVFATITFFKIVSLRANLDFYLQDIRPHSSYMPQSMYVNRWLSNYKYFVGATLDLKKGYLAESYVFFDSPQRVFQGHYSAFNMSTFSVKKKIGGGKGTIGISIIDPFSTTKNLQSRFKMPTHQVNGNFALPFRSFGVNFSWKFGKGNYSPRDRKIINNDQKIEGDTGR